MLYFHRVLLQKYLFWCNFKVMVLNFKILLKYLKLG
jgi:hypothetical protein